MMGGRRWRTSDSTTGTLVHNSHAYTNELNVLKRFDPSLENADVLQTFILEDASVYDKTGRPVELFAVRTQGPFTIRGRVIIDGNQKQRAKNPATKSALIETKLCKRYAIGIFASKDFVTYAAWAGGECGWYEIRPPSASYRPLFDHMIEGVSIYYNMMKAIEDHEELNKSKKGKKRGRGPSPTDLTIETLLFKYAVAVGDGATYDEVVARCDEHAPFLISHFYEDEQAFEWPQTVFFKWIVGRHPDIHASVLEARKKKPGNAIVKKEVPEETDIVALPVVIDKPPTQKTLTRRHRFTQDASRGSDDVVSHDFRRSSSRVKTQVKLRNSPPTAFAKAHTSVEPMDIDAAPLALPQRPTQHQALGKQSNLDLILESLEDLRPELEPLAKNSLSKTSSKLYYRHSIKNYWSSSEILKYYAKELLERLDENVWGGSKFWEQMQQIAANPRIVLEHITVEQIPANLIRRKAKAGKVELEETGNIAAIATPPPKRVGRPAGKMSALRLVGSKGSKRRFDSADDTLDTPDTVSRVSKAAKYSHADDSEEDDGMDDDVNSDISTTGVPSAVKVVVRAENLPTTDAKGPNGAWVCDEEDCGFVVRYPEQDEGHEAVQEHIWEVHYRDENRDARINLAVTEGVKNRLPIDHLLEKIRQMGQKILEKEETSVAEVPVPQPIKRRLIS